MERLGHKTLGFWFVATAERREVEGEMRDHVHIARRHKMLRPPAVMII